MAQLNLVERLFTAFLRRPLSVPGAMRIIVTATAVSVVVGGVLIRLLDPKEISSVWTGMWWALQTVTTVGYGDVVPERPWGRIVGAVIMLEAIAFVAIVTAAITSGFVERARRERATVPSRDAAALEQLTVQLADIQSRVEQIQRALESQGSAGGAVGGAT